MDNKNDWNWNDGDKRAVSSVYREDDETNAFILVNPPQNTKPQKTEIQKTEIQKTEPQKIEIQKAEPQTMEPQKIEIQKTEFRKIEMQDPGPQAAQPRNTHPPSFPPLVVQQVRHRGSEDAAQNADRGAHFDEKDISENKVSAIAAYLLGPVGIIIALLIARDSAYTAFHARAALKITICSAILEIFAAVFALLGMIPLVGIIFQLMLILTGAAWFGVLVLRLTAVVQAGGGEAKEPAVIGSFSFLK